MSAPSTGDDPGPKHLIPRILAYLRARVIRELDEGSLELDEIMEALACLALYDYGGNSEERVIEAMLDFLSQFEEC